VAPARVLVKLKGKRTSRSHSTTRFFFNDKIYTRLQRFKS